MSPQTALESMQQLWESSEASINEATRKQLIKGAKQLLASLETPQETLQRTLYPGLELLGARLAVELNVLQTLAAADGSISTQSLSKSSGKTPDERIFVRILKYLASIGLIDQASRNEWKASPMTKNLAGEAALAGIIHQWGNIQPAYQATFAWLQKADYRPAPSRVDTAFALATGEPFFDWLKHEPAQSQAFNTFMTTHRTGSRSWLDAFDLRRLQHSKSSVDDADFVFVDVGGGIGHQCTAILDRYPDSKARLVLQDLAGVVETSQAPSRVERMPIDFFEGQPVRAASVYYLRSILRDWDDERCKQILGHILSAMSPDSLLFIDEIVIPDVGANRAETQLDMTMMAMLNAQARSETEWHALLEGLGMQMLDVTFYEDDSREGVIVARKVS